MECSCRMFDQLSLLDLAGCAEGEREREGKEGKGKGERAGREGGERGKNYGMEKEREKDYYNCYHQLMRHVTYVYHILIPNSNKTVTQFPKQKQSLIFMNVNSRS